MERFLRFIATAIITLFCFNLWAANSDNAIYTADSGRYAPYSIEQFSQVLLDTMNSYPDRNILLYVHGRGKSPKKSLKSSTIPRMEKTYGVKVILFKWNSWDHTLGRPYQNAIDSAENFGKVLDQLNRLKVNNPEFFEDRSINLLFHSMGAIVLRVFLEDYYFPQLFTKNLFDNVTISAPDVPVKNHHLWMEKLDFSQQIYIALNRDDLILAGSRWAFPEKRDWRGAKLGVTVNVSRGIKSQLAANSIYMDLSRLTFYGHRHFNMPKLLENQKTRNLFRKLFNGKALTFPDRSVGLTKRNGRVFIFKN